MSCTPEEKTRAKPLTPLSSGQMSSSLKNKLKRCGRYHTSTPAKKICLERTTPESSPVLSAPLSQDSRKDLQNNYSPSHRSDAQNLKSSEKYCESDNLNSSSDHNFLSPASRLFNHSPFSAKNLLSNVSSVNKTPLSSKTNRRLSCRTSRLNFSHSDVKKDDYSSEKLDCYSQLNLAKPFGSVGLDGSSPLRKKSEPLNINLSEKENSQRNLVQEIKVKEETLRKLKMVKMYRSKNNLSHLQTLIDKWRQASQQSLQDLHELLPEPKPSMTELLHHLQIEKNLVKYDSKEEDFV